MDQINVYVTDCFGSLTLRGDRLSYRTQYGRFRLDGLSRFTLQETGVSLIDKNWNQITFDCDVDPAKGAQFTNIVDPEWDLDGYIYTITLPCTLRFFEELKAALEPVFMAAVQKR